MKKNAKTFGSIEKSSYLCTRNSEIRHALVAQLVEHLTLNQGVQGSSPCRRTKRRFQQRWSRLFLSTAPKELYSFNLYREAYLIGLTPYPMLCSPTRAIHLCA